MMGVKGKLLKKLKTIKTIGYLKPERILQVNASDAHLCTPHQKSSPALGSPLVAVYVDPKKQHRADSFLVQEAEIIDVSELMKDLDDQEMNFDDEMDEKENLRPKENFDAGSRENSLVMGVMGRLPLKAKDGVLEGGKEFGVEEIGGHFPSSLSLENEMEASSFRRPDLNSRTLFDPNLLAAFEQAIMEVKAREAERRSRIEFPSLWDDDAVDEPPLKTRKIKPRIIDGDDPLLEFEDKCPPGGSDSIIVYTTGLRAIRKTFEDCQKMRSLLENLRVLFFERDISMHAAFKEELWEILGGKTVPPRLFVKGRYIGGVDEVLGLHEQGKLKPLIQGIPRDSSTDGGRPCEGCVGFRFIVCFNCNGSRKVVHVGNGDGGHEQTMNCSECNENGVLVCPFCC